MDSGRKEVEIHSVHSAHNAPIARLRARFGIPTPAPSTPPRDAAERKLPESPIVSPSDLPPELRERWEERVCIMHFDGKIPLETAEALALAEVFGRSDPRADAAAPAKAEQPAAVIQAGLFATEKGPYA